MGSGKSTYLYDKYRAYTKRGSSILCITHTYDTRSDNSICTHSRLTIPAIKLESLVPVDISGYDIIIIDEAQFFPDLVSFVQMHKDKDIGMFIAGLSGDFKQAKFGQLLDLIPLASECVHRTSICDVCGHPAPFSRKKDASSDDQVDPGGFDKYYTACHKHL